MEAKNKPHFAEKDHVLECVRGETVVGKPVFAYVLVKKPLLETFREALRKGDTDLAKYGLIVATGEGHSPSAEFEKQLIASLKKPA